MSIKKYLVVILLLFVSVTSFASGPASIRAFWAAFYGGSSSTFSGGTLTSNLTMSDGALIELATGTSSNLALRLRGDTDTGWYSPSANRIMFRAGGSDVMALQNTAWHMDLTGDMRLTGQIVSSAGFRIGFATTPTYSWSTDEDTGFGRFATGKPSILSDGVTVGVFASDTVSLPVSTVKFGIGTSTPDCALQNQGFTRLGELSPKLKFALFSATLPPNEGDAIAVTTGFNVTKIVSMYSMVATSGYRIPPGYNIPSPYAGAGCLYYLNANYSSDWITVQLAPSGSYGIRGLPITIFVTYTE